MPNFYVRLLIAGIMIAFGAQANFAVLSPAQAEVTTPLQPVKPTYRIIKGTSDEPTAKKPAKPGNSDAARTWAVISETKDISVLDRFIAQFPGSKQALLALNRRDGLVRGSVDTKTNQTQRPEPAVQFEERPEFSRAIQSELFRMGCEPGRPDGQWGRKSIDAANRFSKYAGVTVETGYPNIALLASVQAGADNVCPLECGVKFDSIGGQCVAKTCPSGQKLSSAGACYAPKIVKTCKPGQRLSSKGRCYTPRTVKTCKAGQKLSSKGRCYTPKAAKVCRQGERLSSRGVCFKPKPVKKQVATPRKVNKPKNNRCAWCRTKTGTEVYVCGARITRLQASGDCE